jgi:hypothetical protein
MPRNVRNFWCDLDVDGRSRIGTGPQGRDGGIDAHFYIRDHGSVTESFRVEGRAFGGKIYLTVIGPDGRQIGTHETER